MGHNGSLSVPTGLSSVSGGCPVASAATRGGTNTGREGGTPGRAFTPKEGCSQPGGWQHPRGCHHPKRPLGGDVRPRMLVGDGERPSSGSSRGCGRDGDTRGLQPGHLGEPHPSLVGDRGGGGAAGLSVCSALPAPPCRGPGCPSSPKPDTPPASSLPLEAPAFWCFSKRQPGRGARGTSASQSQTGSGLHRPAPCLCPAPFPACSS